MGVIVILIGTASMIVCRLKGRVVKPKTDVILKYDNESVGLVAV